MRHSPYILSLLGEGLQNIFFGGVGIGGVGNLRRFDAMAAL